MAKTFSMKAEKPRSSAKRRLSGDYKRNGAKAFDLEQEAELDNSTEATSS